MQLAAEQVRSWHTLMEISIGVCNIISESYVEMASIVALWIS